MGVAILGALALYLLVSLGVVLWAISYAGNRNKSVWRWGGGAALIMYLIPFWDWLPTVAIHRYYCATEAGFWVYKTVDQWKQENPGVMETLIERKITVPNRSERVDEDNWKSIYNLNDRFEKSFEHRGSLFMHRWRTEIAWTDSQSGEVLARSIDFYTAQTRGGGGWKGWKFWLAADHCPGYQERAQELSDSIEQLKGARK